MANEAEVEHVDIVRRGYDALSVRSLRLAPQSYDAVVALYSIIHMPLTAQPLLLRAIAGWLGGFPRAPGGVRPRGRQRT